MAQIGSSKVTVLWDEGAAPRWTLYKVRGFNTADTLDVSDRFSGSVEVASFLTSPSTAVGTVTSSTAGVLTLTLAGSTQATAFLTVRGQGSTGA